MIKALCAGVALAFAAHQTNKVPLDFKDCERKERNFVCIVTVREYSLNRGNPGRFIRYSGPDTAFERYSEEVERAVVALKDERNPALEERLFAHVQQQIGSRFTTDGCTRTADITIAAIDGLYPGGASLYSCTYPANLTLPALPSLNNAP